MIFPEFENVDKLSTPPFILKQIFVTSNTYAKFYDKSYGHDTLT